MSRACTGTFPRARGWLHSLAVASVLSVLVACKPAVDSVPIVGLRACRILSLDTSGTLVELRVAVQNPNGFSVRVTAIDLRVGLDGAWVATGSCQTPVDLPGNGVGEFEVRLGVPWDKVSRSDLEALLSAEVPYKVEGTVSIDKPLRKSGLKVNATGRYPVSGPLQVSLRPSQIAHGLVSMNGVKVGDLGFLHQDGILDLTLTNPLTFEVPVAHLDYQLETGGAIVAKGFMNNLVLKPGQNRLPVPMSASILAMGRGVLGRLLNGCVLGARVRGALVLGEPGRERALAWECEPSLKNEPSPVDF